jgi:PQQ-like domain/PKD domain
MGRRVGWERALRRGMIGLAVVLVGGGLVVAGATGGYSAQRPRLLSGAAWLASTQVGQLTLLDGASTETAAQVRVASPGDQLDVVQQGSSAYAVNRSTGAIRRVDGATFDVTPPVSPLPGARAGLRAFAGPNALYAVDTGRGVLVDADARTLRPLGGTISLAGQIASQTAVLDDAGRLWVLDPSTGELVWTDHGSRRSRATGTGSGALLTLADGAPVIVDRARRTATTIDPGTGAPRHSVSVDLRSDDRVQVSGSPHRDLLYVVASRGVLAICDLTGRDCGAVVPIGETGSDLGAAVEAGGRVFVPDYGTGQVWIVDLASERVVAQPRVLGRAARFELLNRDGIVFFNDPASEVAGVIQLDGRVRRAAKYDPSQPGKGLTDPARGGENGTPDAGTPPVGGPPPSGPPPPTAPKPPVPPQQQPTPTPQQPPPDAIKIQIVLNASNPAINQDVNLQVVAPAGGPQPAGATTVWNFGDSQTATGVQVTHHWTAANGYPVTVTAKFPGHPDSSASALVNVTGPAPAQLTVSTSGNGTLTGPGGLSCPGTCSVTYRTGQQVTLTASGNGTVVTGWGGACAGTTGTGCTITMNGDQAVSVSFAVPVRLSLTVVGEGGTVTGPGISCPGSCSATFPPGRQVVLTAHDTAFVYLSDWGGACTGSGTSCTVTMNGDQTVTAAFAKRPVLTVTKESDCAVVNGGDSPCNGPVTGPGIDCGGPNGTTCTSSYNPGQQIVLTIQVPKGWLAVWAGDCANASGHTCVLTMNGDKGVDTKWIPPAVCSPSPCFAAPRSVTATGNRAAPAGPPAPVGPSGGLPPVLPPSSVAVMNIDGNGAGRT